MQTYLVGGAVRDELLGLPVSDRDYVVVGATPEQMIAAGYKPVGSDFPVFLHPITHEEYALARTERKVARGYGGFTFYCAPDVSLEADLERRDLTINAMAKALDGTLIDPFGGADDVRARRFRHVSAAFAEDPVRILRVARFAARFVEFEVVEETMKLMRSMVDSGEVDALVPERVWQEFARGLMQARPSRMMDVLSASDAGARLLPQWSRLFERNDRDWINWRMKIDLAAANSWSLAMRFALLALLASNPAESVEQSVKAVGELSNHLRVPSECRDQALLAVREAGAVDEVHEDRVEPILSVLERADAFRRPERFRALLGVWTLYRTSSVGATYRPAELLSLGIDATLQLDAGAIARSATEQAGKPNAASAIRESLRTARIDAITTAIGRP